MEENLKNIGLIVKWLATEIVPFAGAIVRQVRKNRIKKQRKNNQQTINDQKN